MPYPSRIESIHNETPQQQIAFAYNTKDRTEMSLRSLEPLRTTEGFDLYWMDGSATEVGRSLPAQQAPSIPHLREIHYGITGGPDLAIVYSITYLLAKGYAYVGLIENDVVLEPGWHQRILRLFAQGAQDGLRVGAVSARTFCERVLLPHGDYAVMFNHGAGMVLFTRDAARVVLKRYRTCTAEETRGIVRSRTGVDLTDIFCGGTADWHFDAALLMEGFCSLAPVPSLAGNIDADLAAWGLSLFNDPSQVPERPGAFDCFCRLHHASFEPLPEQCLHHPTLGKLMLPHQLMALPDCVSQDWALIWRQAFGPFALQASGPGATITLPIFGSSVAFILEGGPQAGEVAVCGNEETRVSLLRDTPQHVWIAYAGKGRTVQLKALTTPVVFCGIQLQEVAFYFPSTRPFDFETLRPYVASR